jgi:hypothetical protein
MNVLIDRKRELIHAWARKGLAQAETLAPPEANQARRLVLALVGYASGSGPEQQAMRLRMWRDLAATDSTRYRLVRAER